ncbi:MAG TPA: R3H domain-containing nucleic acid-binding protein [Candidatus Limnocylindria bacterium]|nr:R3H domain-containing nucleic acid-binding protein [Candidatus Limnocylindria bacterium]
MSSEALTELAERATRDLLKAMGFDGQVTGKADGTTVEVTAEVSDDEELLTGRKGETRQALQHLLTRMINRGEGSRYHLQLEINDFWQRRETELEAIAKGLAEEALSGQSEVLTEYLNAQERRIIHVTLREDSRVKTYAIGEGLIKKVAVAPADFPEGVRSEP